MSTPYGHDHHHYQMTKCKENDHLRPILNAACKEDPGRIGSIGAINLDIVAKDVFTGQVLKDRVSNFIQGSVFDMFMFEDKKFGIVVLGEFLEHCEEFAGLRAMLEVRRVLRDDGILIVTFPLDKRAPKDQHGEGLLFEWDNGVTSYHQTIWDEKKLKCLFMDSGFKEKERNSLDYGHSLGWGMVLEKS